MTTTTSSRRRIGRTGRPHCRRPSGRRDERGTATVLGVSLIAVLLLLGCAAGVVAAMFRAHRIAQSAADLAALAAADALATGGDPCAAGARIASANQTVLVQCRVVDRDVILSVQRSGPRWLGQSGDFDAEARAGPVNR